MATMRNSEVISGIFKIVEVCSSVNYVHKLISTWCYYRHHNNQRRG